jgi:hypothetical protein
MMFSSSRNLPTPDPDPLRIQALELADRAGTKAASKSRANGVASSVISLSTKEIGSQDLVGSDVTLRGWGMRMIVD